MPIVLGTAGHIDHGKTSLVRALTGIDCDRLEEEKRRGITIELGFAHCPLPDGGKLIFTSGATEALNTVIQGTPGDVITFSAVYDGSYEPRMRLRECEILDAGS